jgi:hypothetical protein
MRKKANFKNESKKNPINGLKSGISGNNIDSNLYIFLNKYFLINKKVDKGKLSERIGRKVMGLRHLMGCYDCQTSGFFVFLKGG